MNLAVFVHLCSVLLSSHEKEVKSAKELTDVLDDIDIDGEVVEVVEA